LDSFSTTRFYYVLIFFSLDLKAVTIPATDITQYSHLIPCFTPVYKVCPHVRSPSPFPMPLTDRSARILLAEFVDNRGHEAQHLPPDLGTK
jgi:hypothetical protein